MTILHNEIVPDRTATFSGYRYRKLRDSIHRRYSDAIIKFEIQKRIKVFARHLIAEKGYDTFICGMADGFDLYAGEVIKNLKAENPGINLICAVPYSGHGNDSGYPELYNSILYHADLSVTLSHSPNKESYRVRNDYMLARSSALICYYDGQRRSGTQYTYNRAIRNDIMVYNCCNSENGKQLGDYHCKRNQLIRY